MPRAKKKVEGIKEIAPVVEKQPAIDIDALTKTITETVTKKLTVEFENKMQTAIDKISKSTEQRRDRIVVTGEKQYFVEATSDGLQFNKENNDTVLLIGKNGQLATGTKSPKTVGKGSVHFKAGAPSEAVVPTSGDGSTRGLIVEGDGDDNKTFVFRAASRMNRQGFNVFSDGAVSLGSLKKIRNSTLSLYHRHADTSAFTIDVPSLQYESSAFNVDVNAETSDIWTAISVKSNTNNIFSVDGTGSVNSSGSYFANARGYAEMFEWADNNHRNEAREGITVAFDKEGKLISADEGDNVIGVVVNNPAFVSNAAWNEWHKKYETDELGNINHSSFNIVEWLEMETTTLKSVNKFHLPDNFILPESATEIQSDSNGNAFNKRSVSQSYDLEKTYVPRKNRNSWAMVCVLGVAPVFKGQQMGKNWVRIKELNDELDLWLIR